MGKFLAGGVSVLDVRNGRERGTVKINYMNRPSDKTILKNPVVSIKNGQYSSRPGSNAKLIFSALKDNIPTQKWITDSANILKGPRSISIGTMTSMEPFMPTITPTLPRTGNRIPVAQGRSMGTMTEGLLTPNEPRPMVNASQQTLPVSRMEQAQQIVYYNVNQTIPVTNQFTTNQQFVDNTQNQQIIQNDNTVNNQFVSVDQSKVQQNQYVDNSQFQQNQTMVRQEYQHLVNNNQLNLAIENKNILNSLSILSDPSGSGSGLNPSASYNQGLQQITLDRRAFGNANGSLAIEYPMDSVDMVTRPSVIVEPVEMSNALVKTGFDVPKFVPILTERKKKKRKLPLTDITND